VYFVTYNEKDGLAEVAKIPDYIGHSKLVSKICWTVKSGETLLATCSYDHSVRVYSVTTKIES
jgi:WD40 repeat protein